MRNNRLFIVAAVMMLLFITVMPSAAAAKVRISIDSVKAQTGDSLAVGVRVSGDDVGRIDAIMEYDAGKLSYISGGQSKGDTGQIQLKKAGTGEDITFNLSFRALSGGNCGLKVSRAEVYDLDEQPLKSYVTGGRIAIEGKASAGESEEDVSGDESGDEDTDISDTQSTAKDEGLDDQSSDDQENQEKTDPATAENTADDQLADENKKDNNMILYVAVGIMILILVGAAIWFKRRR